MDVPDPFHLFCGPMGLDSVELVMRIERDFDVAMPDESARAIVTGGDMVEWLQRELDSKQARGASSRHWTRSELLEAVRDIIVDEVGVARDRIVPAAKIRQDLDIN